jgi:hypothetical protein
MYDHAINRRGGKMAALLTHTKYTYFMYIYNSLLLFIQTA